MNVLSRFRNLSTAQVIAIALCTAVIIGSHWPIRPVSFAPDTLTWMRAAEQPGCVGDLISRGLYCTRQDQDGNVVVSRAY